MALPSKVVFDWRQSDSKQLLRSAARVGHLEPDYAADGDFSINAGDGSSALRDDEPELEKEQSEPLSTTDYLTLAFLGFPITYAQAISELLSSCFRRPGGNKLVVHDFLNRVGTDFIDGWHRMIESRKGLVAAYLDGETGDKEGRESVASKITILGGSPDFAVALVKYFDASISPRPCFLHLVIDKDETDDKSTCFLSEEQMSVLLSIYETWGGPSTDAPPLSVVIAKAEEFLVSIKAFFGTFLKKGDALKNFISALSRKAAEHNPEEVLPQKKQNCVSFLGAQWSRFDSAKEGRSGFLRLLKSSGQRPAVAAQPEVGAVEGLISLGEMRQDEFLDYLDKRNHMMQSTSSLKAVDDEGASPTKRRHEPPVQNLKRKCAAEAASATSAPSHGIVGYPQLRQLQHEILTKLAELRDRSEFLLHVVQEFAMCKKD